MGTIAEHIIEMTGQSRETLIRDTRFFAETYQEDPDHFIRAEGNFVAMMAGIPLKHLTEDDLTALVWIVECFNIGTLQRMFLPYLKSSVMSVTVCLVAGKPMGVLFSKEPF